MHCDFTLKILLTVLDLVTLVTDFDLATSRQQQIGAPNSVVLVFWFVA